MTITIRSLALLCAAALPFSSFAQSPDLAYCSALVQKYQHYVVKSGSHSPNTGSLDGQVAMEQCRSGNTTGIPVLEQKLRSNGVELPARG